MANARLTESLTPLSDVQSSGRAGQTRQENMPGVALCVRWSFHRLSLLLPRSSNMQITLFCEGNKINFSFSDEQGSVFIESCKNLLVDNGFNPDEISLMDNNFIVRKAAGSADYNNHHKAVRKDLKTKVLSYDSEIDPDLNMDYFGYPSAEDEFLAHEEAERVRQMIYHLLPSGQADVFYLHAIDGLTFKEIGKYLGKKLDTVAHSYYDAVKNLRKNAEDIKNTVLSRLN